jgi:hypothetical protein
MYPMAAHDTQTFFKPAEFSCQQKQLPAKIYNLAHVLLNRSKSTHLFIPIRSMQYLAIIEADTFWFVDSLAYAVRNNEGGRLIAVSWHPVVSAQDRADLNQHMTCRVIFYGEDRSDIQIRLQGELFTALQLLDQRYREKNIPQNGAQILPFNLI